MIDAVLFDLFETLITNPGSRRRGHPRLPPFSVWTRPVNRAEWKARRPRVVLGQMSFADALTEICETVTGRADALLLIAAE